MSAFGNDKKHVVTFEVRGPKTRKEVKAYMKKIKRILLGLPGNIRPQTFPSAKGRPKPRKRKPKRRRDF